MLLVLAEFPGALPTLHALASPTGGGSAQVVCRRFVEGLESAREHYFSGLGLMLVSFPHKKIKVKCFLSPLHRSVPKAVESI